MSTMTFFFILIIFLAVILLSLNLLLAPHNPYQEKVSSFECGYSSFLGQNRQEFHISFFLFALLFLIFDLEIVLIYPYVVSAYNNSVYGLVIVLIFLGILTAGFVFELGKSALKINSRQSNYLNNINLSPSASASSLPQTQNGFNKKLNLNLSRRFYSTNNSSSGQFWRKVNSRDTFDSENPFTIVNNFFKEYPKISQDPKLAKDQITVEFLSSVLSRQIQDFDLTKKELDNLRQIKPKRIELPVKDKDTLLGIVGKYVRNGETGVAGAYIFTNKNNQYTYVGSSISLANRLSTGYFGPKLGGRKIDLAIRDVGLDSFSLDLYILPEELIENLDNTIDKGKIKSLTLALEQILILWFNPEYNVLKVAGSPAGYKHSEESIKNNRIRNSKAYYIYDELNKELLYVSASQQDMAQILGISPTNFSRYKETKYLNRFIFSNTTLNSEEYSENLLDAKSLKEFVKGISKEYKLKLVKKNLSKTRAETIQKISKRIEMTNVKTNEVLIFDSTNKTASYLKELNPDYKCSAGTVSDNATKGRIYKGLF